MSVPASVVRGSSAPPAVARSGGAWLVVVAAFFPLVAPAEWPPWLVMWTTAFAVYVACKWVTWTRAETAALRRRSVAYFVAWPGLDAPAFLAGESADRPRGTEWAFAAAKCGLGVALLAASARLMGLPDLTRGWIGMTGVIFTLHFGLFHLLSCFWRARGIDAKPLMDWPVAARSAGEFWGRRWNTAFRDLAHRFLFRPLAARFGPRAGLFAGFLFSGLVHDAVISLPARGGYGGPTAYFLIQAGALLAERSRIGRRTGLGRGLRGRLFAATAVILPAPLLFHTPFVTRVVLPFVDLFGVAR